MADIRISFPVDLGKGREVTDEVAEQYFQHVEKDVARGFFPLGHNTVWHGGVHVYGGENTPVYAMFDGTVVAAYLEWVGAEDTTPGGEILDGTCTLEEMGQRIFELILRTASGEPSKSELLGLGDNEFVPWQIGIMG